MKKTYEKNLLTKINWGGRLAWLDSLKGLTIIAVVLGHALLGFGENNVFGEYNDFFWRLKDWIYIWHMPLFLCLSGFSFCLAYFRNNAINKNRVKKQVLNLLLLYIIFSIVFYGLKIFFVVFTDNKMTFEKAIMNMLFPDTLMWYLWVLAIYYIGLLCCKPLMKIMTEKPLTILVILLIIAFAQKISAACISWRLCFGNLLHGAFYFCLGVVLCVHNGKCLNKVSINWIWTIVVIIILHFIYYVGWSVEWSIFDVFVDEIIAILIIVLMFVIVPRICDSVGGKLLPTLGRASLVIYLLHTYIVTAMKVVSIRLRLCRNLIMDIFVLILSTVVPIAICCFINWLKGKNRVLGAVFAPGKLINKHK